MIGHLKMKEKCRLNFFELVEFFLTKDSTNKTKKWNQNFILIQGKLRKNSSFPNQTEKSTSNSKVTK